MTYPMSQQLILQGLQCKDTARLDNFYPGQNSSVLHYLAQLSQTPEQWLTYLWGKPDTGRTHLLNAVSFSAHEQGLSVIYLPLAEYAHLEPAIFDNLEVHDRICLDDIDALAGNMEWETAFFHLYNRIYAAGHQLVLTANLAPRHLPLILPDLQSRLLSGMIFHLHELSDTEKLAALTLRAEARGLLISPEVGDFLLRRISRRLNDLFAALDRLDHASLAAQRRLTIPFVKAVLQL